jgi:hypothetical protein
VIAKVVYPKEKQDYLKEGKQMDVVLKEIYQSVKGDLLKRISKKKEREKKLIYLKKKGSRNHIHLKKKSYFTERQIYK